MSKISLLLLLFSVSVIVYAQQQSVYQQQDNRLAWELVRDENNIQVYTVESGSSEIIKAKAVAVISSPLDDIKQILDNVEQRHEWVPYLLRSRIVETRSEVENIEYALFAAPWPASDRDFIYSVQVREYSPAHLLYVMKSIEMASVPENNSIVRAELFESIYSLTAIEKNTTKVEVIFHTDPKGWLPGWIVNIIQKALPYKIMKNLRARADSNYLQQN